MLKSIALAASAALAVAAGAAAQTCATYPNTLTNGTTADADQVMANFNCAAALGNARFTANVAINNPTISTGATLSITPTGNSWNEGIEINPSPIDGYDGVYLRSTANSIVSGWSIGNASSSDGTGAHSFFLSLNGLTGMGGTGRPDTPLSITTSGVARFGGAVGIGTTTPSYLLYVNGTAYASGAAGALSDARHKDEIKPLRPGALQIVQALKPVTFVWKKPMDDGMRGEQIGFIAQDVQKTLPDVVLVENNAEKTLGIKYTEIIPVLTAAIQEQQAEIAELRAKVVALEAAAGARAP